MDDTTSSTSSNLPIRISEDDARIALAGFCPQCSFTITKWSVEELQMRGAPPDVYNLSNVYKCNGCGVVIVLDKVEIDKILKAQT